MAVYKEIVFIDLCHDYFVNSMAKNFLITPALKSENLLKNCGILFKYQGNRGTLIYNTEQIESLIKISEDEDDELVFTIYIDNMYFSNFTPSTKSFENFIYLFSFDFNKKNERGGYLSKSEKVSEADLVEITDQIISNDLTSAEKRKTPGGLIKFKLKDIVSLIKNNDKINTYINFEAIKSFWNYYIIPRDGNTDILLKIKDIRGTVEFSDAKRVIIFEKLNAIKITSLTPLEIKEISSYHFQLIEINKQSEKIIQKKIPVADTRVLITSGNEGEVYSNIYLYN